MPFDGFISYSHAADGRLAPAVQRGLHRLAKPWHQRRALWIFRDQTGLAVTPKLWTSIQEALDGSRHFVLLASPEAARSPWVNREIEHWLATKSPDRILPVVTDGDWQWDPDTRDFTADSTAVPDTLRGVFDEEPLYLDLRWARDDLHLSLQHIRFRDAIAQLAAPMHGLSKDELEGEDVRQHRRARRLSTVAASMLVLLTLVASVTGVVAVRNADRANAAATDARHQQQLASQQRSTAERATEESRRQQDNARTQEVRAQQAGAETRRQEQLAGHHQTLAKDASTEARRQQALAEDASAEAKREQARAGQYRNDAARQKADAEKQKALAEKQKELAEDAAEEAARQKEDAERQAANARRQEELANQAAARAKEQEQIAEHHRELARQADEERKRQEQLAREAAEEARRQRETAERQQRMVVNKRLIDRARALVDDDPKKALMLGVAAQRLHDDADTRQQLAHLAMATTYAGNLSDAIDVQALAGHVVATSGADGSVSLWNTAEPARPVRLAQLPGDGTPNRELAAARDGRTLVVFDGRPEAARWDVTNPSDPVRMTPLTDAAGITAVDFRPDGQIVATSNRDKNTVLWNVTGEAPAAVTTLTGAYPLKFGPDGRTAITSGSAVKVWDVTDPAAPAQRATIDAGFGTEIVEATIAVNPKLPIVAVEGPNDAFYFYNVTDPANPVPGHVKRGGSGNSTHTSIEFGADGSLLAIGDSTGMTWVFSVDFNDGRPWLSTEITTLATRGAPIRGMTFSLDGRTLVTAGDRSLATLWNPRGRYARDPISTITGPFPSRVMGLAFAPDNRTLTASELSGSAVPFDLTDPARPVRQAAMPLQSGAIEGTLLSRDGRTMAVLGTDRVVTVLDVSRPAGPVVMSRISEPGAAAVYMLTLSADGTTVAIGRADGRTALWDVTDQKNPAKLSELALRRPLASLAFSPDGRILAAGEGNHVSLYDVTNRSAPVRVTAMPLADYSGYNANTLEFSPDGRTLASGINAGSATLWDVADPSQPRKIGVVPVNNSLIMSMSFSPDGRTLTFSTMDNSVTRWDISDPGTPLRIAILKSPDMGSFNTVLSGDGSLLAAAGIYVGPTRNITLWDVATPKDLAADPLRHACAISGRGLNADEWGRYIPELPHQPTC